jgi:hypothetical protein
MESHGGEPRLGSYLVGADTHKHEREQRDEQAASVFEEDAIARLLAQ